VWSVRLALLLSGLAPVVLTGCAGDTPSSRRAEASPAKAAAQAASTTSNEEEASIKEERAKLSPEDRALVEAQEWCVINNEDRLGAMGPPVKIEVKGQPVFLCCKSCQKKALAEPDQTLAKLEELKAKKKAQPPAP
jgi:hypothetical protein